MSRAAAFAMLLALAGCGGSKSKEKDPFAAAPKRTTTAPANVASPRFEQIAALDGSGAMTKAIQVSSGALRWRTRARCPSGQLTVTVMPAPRSGPGSAQQPCSGKKDTIWAGTGPQRLAVRAPGKWQLVVEQEVTTPLQETPLPAMRSARAQVVGRGNFYMIERKGEGSAVLYRLADGRLALRMNRFATDPNTDLSVWLSEAAKPQTTQQVFKAKHTVLSALKSTVGDQNYLLPPALDAKAIRSIVIWANPDRIAHAAASLNP